MSLNQKKALLIASGVVVLLLAFFLVFRRNQATIEELNAETRQLTNQVNFLSQLQMEVHEMQGHKEEYENSIEEYTNQYPCKITQQKAIYNVYQLMQHSKVDVTSIQPNSPVAFFQGGVFLGDAGAADSSAAASSGTESGVSVTEDPEQQVSVDQMVGQYTRYEVQLSGTRSQIMKAIDWLANNKEHMSVEQLNFSYDKTTGKLSGALSMNFYALNGNGEPYKEPNIKGITIGTDNIMGKMKK